ncbi:MAG: DUF4411 family protein [Geminicoccaceae bacterium]|nr:DUF4411 family protein [Geminicoccaceae bacterium]
MILVDTNVVIRSYEAAAALVEPDARARGDTAKIRDRIDERWRSLLQAGEVGTVEEVLKEIRQEPSLRWKRMVERDFKDCIHKQTTQYYDYLAKVGKFVEHNWCESDAEAFSKNAADPHSIAMAAAHGCAVATLETHSPPHVDASGKFRGKVSLPYVAWRFGVRCATIYELFTAPGRP